jgi:hypothetical protein
MLARHTLIAVTLLSVLTRSAPADTWAFVHPPDPFTSAALLDLRSMNEPTAGQTGFIRASPNSSSPTGGFLRGDGTPIRFWACGSDLYTSDAQILARHARFLAKLGVNMVRIHAQISSSRDGANLTDVSQKQIDGIWRAVAAFKREGIYVTISPYWATDRPVANWGIDGYDGRSDLWGLLFFNPRLQQGYKAWAAKLYAQKNPYTGIPLSQDPAVAIIEVQNEDGLFFWTVDAIHPAQKQLLGRIFGKWLAVKYGSLNSAWDAWDNISQTGDDFSAGDVAILPIYQLTVPHRAGMARRLRDQLEFFAALERDFYTHMVNFYRHDLGCRQLINGCNWLTADPVTLSDVERYCNTPADVMAVNKYFNAVHVGKNVGWRIDPGDFFTDHPAVLNPWDLPTNLKQATGHPMIVTESTWVSPMDFQDEAPFLVAAYESLNGLAGYYWFTATAEEYLNDPRFPFVKVAGQFPLKKWTISTPSIMGNFPAAAIMYRNGYVQQGQPAVIENRPLNDLWNRKPPIISEGAAFDPNRMSGQPTETGPYQQDVDPLAFLVGPVLINYGGDPRNNQLADFSTNIDPQKKLIISNTGQIRMDYNIGLCTLDAPAAQGATGFLKSASPVHLSTIDFSSGNSHATVLAVSMDGKPLSESSRILMQVGAAAHLAGWTQQPIDFTDNGRQYQGFKIAQTGQPPWLIENNDITLTIRNPHLSQMTALDTAGYPTTRTPLKCSGDNIQFRFPAGSMYAILN